MAPGFGIFVRPCSQGKPFVSFSELVPLFGFSDTNRWIQVGRSEIPEKREERATHLSKERFGCAFCGLHLFFPLSVLCRCSFSALLVSRGWIHKNRIQNASVVCIPASSRRVESLRQHVSGVLLTAAGACGATRRQLRRREVARLRAPGKRGTSEGFFGVVSKVRGFAFGFQTKL